MKKCIWCSKDESNSTFNKKAHTVPQSLGGNEICSNVCDKCNEYFGNRTNGFASIETVLKEFLHLSQYILLLSINQPIRLKSEFFDISKKLTIRTKPRYSLTPGFQSKLIRQFKRGLYKIFLEERERQCNDGHDERFNFIREFSRGDLGDYPIFYVKPYKGIILFQTTDVKNPALRFAEYAESMDANFRMFEFMLCGHNIIVPTSKMYLLRLKDFLKDVQNRPVIMGTELVELKSMRDIDVTFQHLKNN